MFFAVVMSDPKASLYLLPFVLCFGGGSFRTFFVCLFMGRGIRARGDVAGESYKVNRSAPPPPAPCFERLSNASLSPLSNLPRFVVSINAIGRGVRGRSVVADESVAREGGGGRTRRW